MYVEILFAFYHVAYNKELIQVNILTAMMERTSYRGKYKNERVPRIDLIKIMKAGLAAPSGCNKQTTSLIAVDDTDLLKKSREVIKPQIVETAPAIICVLTQKVYAYRDKCFNVQDYYASIENMLLAAIELGYQSCWIEGHITDCDAIGRKMADILEVPADYDLICFLPIGIAKQSLTHTNKKSFEERAWFNGFKKL